jgi:hypothetical protein
MERSMTRPRVLDQPQTQTGGYRIGFYPEPMRGTATLASTI